MFDLQLKYLGWWWKDLVLVLPSFWFDTMICNCRRLTTLPSCFLLIIRLSLANPVHLLFYARGELAEIRIQIDIQNQLFIYYYSLWIQTVFHWYWNNSWLIHISFTKNQSKWKGMYIHIQKETVAHILRYDSCSNYLWHWNPKWLCSDNLL